MNLLFYIFLAVLARCSASMYKSDPEVIELTDQDFSQIVLQSDEIWVVEFYEQWNGDCQKFKPEYLKVARSLKGVAKVAAIDGKANPSSALQCGVKLFPTIKILVDKNKPQHYSGEWTAIAVTDEVKKISAEHQGVTVKTDTSSTTSSPSTQYGSSKSSKTSSDNLCFLSILLLHTFSLFYFILG